MRNVGWIDVDGMRERERERERKKNLKAFRPQKRKEK